MKQSAPLAQSVERQSHNPTLISTDEQAEGREFDPHRGQNSFAQTYDHYWERFVVLL